MNRCLDFFEPSVVSSIEKPVAEAYARGARKAVVVGASACGGEVCDLLQKSGFSLVEKPVAVFQASDIGDNDLVVISAGAGDDVSRVLHVCIDADVTVIAPITDHHGSRRTVFLLSMPKAGTHMLIRLFGLMGLERSSGHAPRPGTWSTPVGYEYHAPCRELLVNDGFDPVGRQLLFRSPAIFVYRNPLDIVVSELDWFMKPENAFSGYLNCFSDEAERLSRLIADDTVMGSIRDRVNRYTGWMNFNNVIPVSYEELVGSRGGGSDAMQSDSIWSLLLKLHIAGSPEELAKQLYDPGSATFSKGKIGRHAERFGSGHFALLDSLPQDFMRALGYSKDLPISSKVTEMLHRPLVVKRLPDEVMYTPRLVWGSSLGWNIVELNGRYFPVRQGDKITSHEEWIAFSREKEGFASLIDSQLDVVYRVMKEPVCQDDCLVSDGFLGFNLVCRKGRWYGIAQAVGQMDVDSLSAEAIETMRENGQYVTGESAIDIKVEILKLNVSHNPSTIIDRLVDSLFIWKKRH